jgi:hypothetical protein
LLSGAVNALKGGAVDVFDATRPGGGFSFDKQAVFSYSQLHLKGRPYHGVNDVRQHSSDSVWARTHR